jgi:hypothetical protein
MTIILEKGQQIGDVLPKNRQSNGIKKLNARKYIGILKLNEDPLKIQKKLRNEWE